MTEEKQLPRELISSLTHLIGALSSIAGLAILVSLAAARDASPWHIVSFAILMTLKTNFFKYLSVEFCQMYAENDFGWQKSLKPFRHLILVSCPFALLTTFSQL